MAVLESSAAARDSEVQPTLASRYAMLFQRTQQGVALYELICDAAGHAVDYRIVDFNDQFERQTGLGRLDAVGQPASVAFGTSPPPFFEEFCSVGLGGAPRQVEQFVSATRRHYHVSIVHLADRAFATILSDVTLLHHRLDEIERERLALRAVLDNQPYPTWIKDEEGHYLAANKAFAEAAGLVSPEAAVGKTDTEIWSSERAEARRSDDREVMETAVPRTSEEVCSSADGLRWFETSTSPVFAADGIVCGTTGVSQDITAQKRAEEFRRQSARNFERVVDLAPDPIAISKASGEVLYVNRAFCAVTGYSHEELLGRHVLDMGVWDHPQARRDAIEQLQREGRFSCIELSVVSPTGIRRNVELTGAIVELEERQVLITAMRDVTENRQAKEKARKSAETLTQYCNLSLDLLCVTDRTARFVWLNSAWERTLGYSVSELEGTKFLDLVHPDDISDTLQAMSQLGAGQKVFDFRNRYRHTDGSWRWLEWRSVADEHGRIYAVARDVTTRREAEAALLTAERTTAASREQLLRVSELAHIGHFMIDITADNVVWTSELYRIFGRNPEEFTPTIDSVRACVSQEDLPRIDAAIRAVVESGNVQQLQFRLARPSGEQRFCHAIIEGASGETSDRSCVFGLVQDLTELWRAETEQRRLEQQVMQAQKLESLGVLAGGIAHDFNNLLTSILGNADLALGGLSTEDPARTYLTDIEKVSRRAADLCRQMLAYSGKGRFVVQPLSLNDVVREMAHLLSVSISKKAVLKYDLHADLPQVVADATQLRQVVMNLITNASEAIVEPSGVVTLSTGIVDCEAADFQDAVGDGGTHRPGKYVYLEVADTGCGMESDTLNRIFDPFFTTKFAGRGLGLAAVLGIVRGHKGALQVRSEKGGGTRFKMLLPAEGVEALPAEIDANPNGEWKGHGLVLLADDDDSIRSMASAVLERAGFSVITAGDGREAVERYALHRGSVRLVVLDLTMPNLDGAACFRELTHLEPNVKVIIASAYNEQDVMSRFVGKCPVGFVQKPYNAADLLPRLRAALGE